MSRFGAVLVFGDIGRSPRMQNHALEIVKHTSYNVYLIGYNGRINKIIYQITVIKYYLSYPRKPTS